MNNTSIIEVDHVDDFNRLFKKLFVWNSSDNNWEYLHDVFPLPIIDGKPISKDSIDCEFNLLDLANKTIEIGQYLISSKGPALYKTIRGAGADSRLKSSSAEYWMNATHEHDQTMFHVDEMSIKLQKKENTTVDFEKRNLTAANAFNDVCTDEYEEYHCGSCVNVEVDGYGPDMRTGLILTDVTQRDAAVADDITAEVIDFWTTNENYTLDKVPPKQGQISAREYDIKTRITVKTTMTKYPMIGRPIFTKKANTEFNAISTRLHSIDKLRKYKMEPKYEIDEFLNTYGKEGWQDMLKEWRLPTSQVDYRYIQKWLTGRKGADKIASELGEILEEGFVRHNLNSLEVHAKLESVMKINSGAMPIDNHEARLIVWHRKGVCALFSEAFKELKVRLKLLLRANVVYADGLTPKEICSKVNTCSRANVIVENDLKKQDKQTDADMLACEKELYSRLGMNQEMLDFWFISHGAWRYKSRLYKGYLSGMRMTGQATTALGNVIVNLICHRELFSKHCKTIELMLVLGDDNAILIESEIDVKGLGTRFQERCNMTCECSQSRTVGCFLRQLISKRENGQWTLTSDPIRLKNRFEVTNGQHAVTDEVLKMRGGAYLIMLGGGPLCNEVWTKLGYEGCIEQWSDQQAMLNACAEYYDVKLEVAYNNFFQLLNMIEKSELYEFSLKHYTQPIG